MDTKALRQKILDLAIRGKLVPQDPNDEPASVLLERIREEKKQMVKEGKLKAKDIKNDTIIFKGEDNLHYEKFQDGTVKCIEAEIPFEIPERWEWTRVKNITCKVGAGSTPTGGASVYSGEGIKFIRSQNVYEDGLVLDDIVYISETINEKMSGSIVRPKDILLNITGGSIGRSSLVPDDFDIGNVNQHVLIVRMVDPDIRQFIHTVIISPYVQSLIIKRQVGSGRGGLSAASFLEFLLPIPPGKEQIQINAQLDKIFCQISSITNSKEAVASTIEVIKNKILDLAIRGKLVPQDSNDVPASVLLDRIRAEKEALIKQGKLKRDKKESIIYRGDDNSYYEKFTDGTIDCIDDEIPFEIPASWCFIRLKEVFDLLSGRDLPSSDYNDNNKGIPYITGASNFKNGKVIINRWTPSPQVITETGDLLVTCKGTVGELSVNTVGQAHIARQVMAIRNLFSLNIYYLQSVISYYVGSLKNQSKGLIPGISREDILQIILPIPPRAEQDRIIEMQRQISHSISNIEANLK